MRPLLLLGSTILSVTLSSAVFAQAPATRPHNVVLFVADGLRFRIVDDHTAPTMATGHMLGDIGDFSNTIFAGFEVPGAAKTRMHAVWKLGRLLAKVDRK